MILFWILLFLPFALAIFFSIVENKNRLKINKNKLKFSKMLEENCPEIFNDNFVSIEDYNIVYHILDKSAFILIFDHSNDKKEDVYCFTYNCPIHEFNFNLETNTIKYSQSLGHRLTKNVICEFKDMEMAFNIINKDILKRI